MLARIHTVAFEGISVLPVDVEVQITNGLPAFTIVGLPDKAVAESRERVRGALHAMGLALPPKRITVNLAPADVTKEGSHYDLPLALGLLVAMGVIPADAVADHIVLGELGLDGSLRSVSGVLPTAMHAAANDNGLICPHLSRVEAQWSGIENIISPKNLLQFINHVKGTQVMSDPPLIIDDVTNEIKPVKDLSDIKGQETAKRALEITAAGGHNLLMCGMPGSGKSMLAERLPTILPPLSPKQALEVSMIHSLAGTLPENGLIKARPFRNPHHSASLAALIGGGSKARPGEISLAHHGVLFLDELPEFARATIESLRQPMETREAVIARVQSRAVYPADFQLIAAMNPCRCGYLGDQSRECTRAPKCGIDYQAKLSGPFLDRMDIFVDVPPVSIADLKSDIRSEPSATIRARVEAAYERQYMRNGAGRLNASLTAEEITTLCILEQDASELFDMAATKLNLSARAYHRTLKVARTIADLSGEYDKIRKQDIAEALSFRMQTYLNA